jgi:ATP-dependent DNA helicase RecG
VENQNIEYKQSWRDEYLKWLCGFANSHGGKIFIGIDDKGKVSGVEDYKKLMDDIPNKAVNHLGLVVDVNLHKKK